jgi:hypothetical protein
MAGILLADSTSQNEKESICHNSAKKYTKY